MTDQSTVLREHALLSQQNGIKDEQAQEQNAFQLADTQKATELIVRRINEIQERQSAGRNVLQNALQSMQPKVKMEADIPTAKPDTDGERISECRGGPPRGEVHYHQIWPIYHGRLQLHTMMGLGKHSQCIRWKPLFAPQCPDHRRLRAINLKIIRSRFGGG